MTSLLGKIINQTPVPFTSRRATSGLRLPWATRNDPTAQLEAFGQVSTLFSIVDRISNATSQVHWRLWRTRTDGRQPTATGEEDQRTEVTRHAALDLWRKPNPFMGRGLLVETVQQHYELTGEGWIVIARNPRSTLPLELWPVRPDRMEPIPHPTKYLAGYIYTSVDGEQVPLTLDQVLYFRRPSPTDPYRGIGAVQAAMVDLEAVRDAAEWNRNFFRNSAEPGGIIEVDKRLEDDEWDQLVERWREQHQGVNNAHRVAVLEQGKWVERKYTQKDMQFAELRGVSREVIREAFGIHGHMLGISEDVNKANAFAGEVSFARWIVFPRAQRWKDILNDNLLPIYDATNVEFDHDRVVPEDREADDRERKSKAESAKLLVEAGYDPAEVTRVVGLPEMAYRQNAADADPAAAENPHTPASDARNLVEMVQKVYLGVGVVLTADEAREILNRAGANLQIPAPPLKPETDETPS